MNSIDARQKYLDFFEAKGHKVLPSSSLVPENDPTTLFTGSGMQPMVPYLLGEVHPLGTRLVDSQRCFRAEDIEEIGDNRHTTYFEMLGNWSLGDYFKEEQISWMFEFLTKELLIDPQRLYVTAFIGDEQYDLPKDTTAAEIWKKLFSEIGIEAKEFEIGSEADGYQKGMGDGRIFYYNAKKNWWSRSGPPDKMPTGEPGGPSSEMFYLFPEVEHDTKYGENCHPNCDCGRFMEIGNNVFMQYKKQGESFEKLPHNNVDFGGGLERLLSASLDEMDVFKTDLFWPIIENIQADLNVLYGTDEKITKTLRVVADHIKAATFLIKDGVIPSNKLQGYVLRRLIRRAAVKLELLREDGMSILPELALEVAEIYQGTDYLSLEEAKEVKLILAQEVDKFRNTLAKGLKEINKIEKIDAKQAFDLYQSYGFPIELTAELFAEKGQEIDLEKFQEEFEKHKELSRTTSAGMFKGGLADQQEKTTKLHTANHLLQAALRQVIGDHLGQRGSNITAERLRFDFNHDEKLTDEQLKQVEDLVNQKIQEDLKVHFDIEDKAEAVKNGALSNFGENYPEKVKVYKMGKDEDYFSKELCGGPHVEHTAVLGKFKILKQESVSAGIKRIYATIE